MKKMKTYMKPIILLTALFSILLTSCVNDDFDKPEIIIPTYDGNSNCTIANLKAMYQGTLDSIEQDTVIQGIVVANDESGNFYKTLIIQDGTAGIEVKIDRYDMYTSFKVGQRVFIKCKGLYLGDYGKLVQLGYIYNGAIGRIPDVIADKHIFRDSLPGLAPAPKILTIPTLTPEYLSMLVQINDVHFAEPGALFAEPSATTNRTIEDENGNTLTLRTSNYASFAANKLPHGKGNIRGILSIFNGGYQFYIRDLNDIVNWDDPTANAILYETFSVDPTTNGWIIHSVAGSKNWYFNSGYKNMAITASGSDVACDDYLITPAISLSGANPILTLKSWTRDIDAGFAEPLEVLISTNFSGDPNTTTWTKLNVTLASQNSQAWTESNEVSLSSYSGKTVRIAFHYRSSGVSSGNFSAWQIDDVKIAK